MTVWTWKNRRQRTHNYNPHVPFDNLGANLPIFESTDHYGNSIEKLRLAQGWTGTDEGRASTCPLITTASSACYKEENISATQHGPCHCEYVYACLDADIMDALLLVFARKIWLIPRGDWNHESPWMIIAPPPKSSQKICAPLRKVDVATTPIDQWNDY